MEIYTIGFTRKSVKDFFEPLKQSGIARFVDVRVNNTAHLAVSPPSVISPISLEAAGSGLLSRLRVER